jgi:glycosyltransferase involved in cell wall biosynthesis
MKLLSFILPVYRNQGSIKTTCNQIHEHLIRLHASLDYEIIIVNDGSDDSSWEEIIEISSLNKKVKALSFSRNFGQVPAIIAGARHCKGDAAIIMSADLQDPVSLISEMIHSWEASAEIAICYRMNREDSLMANFTSGIFYRFMKIANPNMPKGGFDFVLLDKKALDVFANIDERNRFFQGDILWMGFNIKFIPYKRMKRTTGKSQWSFSKKLKYFIDGSLNTSYLSIRFMSVMGIITALLGFLYALVVVYLRFINDVPFKGYAPIVIILLVIGGMTMIMLGIIGEYLWRIYDETRKRPIYLIKEKAGNWDSEV